MLTHILKQKCCSMHVLSTYTCIHTKAVSHIESLSWINSRPCMTIECLYQTLHVVVVVDISIALHHPPTASMYSQLVMLLCRLGESQLYAHRVVPSKPTAFLCHRGAGASLHGDCRGSRKPSKSCRQACADTTPIFKSTYM